MEEPFEQHASQNIQCRAAGVQARERIVPPCRCRWSVGAMDVRCRSVDGVAISVKPSKAQPLFEGRWGDAPRYIDSESAMTGRKIQCPCGHWMTAADDDELFWVVRRHIDDQHLQDGYTDQAIRAMVQAEAVDA